MGGLFGGGRKDNSGAMMQQMQQQNQAMMAQMQKSNQEFQMRIDQQQQDFQAQQAELQAQQKKDANNNRKTVGGFYGAGAALNPSAGPRGLFLRGGS